MCSDMVTYMFYVFGHAYISVLCVRTCLHICFMCSDMLTYMFYVFGHGYFIIESNAKKLPFIPRYIKRLTHAINVDFGLSKAAEIYLKTHFDRLPDERDKMFSYP